MVEPSADHKIVHDYLKSLSKYLARLEKADAEEVLREIESHIFDALEAQEAERGATDAKAILEGFGDPRDLASGYVGHILEGTPPPAGFRAIEKVKKGATWGLYYTTGFFGLMISLGLIFTGLAKPFAPERVGLWIAEHGNSIMIGMRDTPAGTTEVLGWWFMPLALAFGAGGIYLTLRLLKLIKQAG